MRGYDEVEERFDVGIDKMEVLFVGLAECTFVEGMRTAPGLQRQSDETTIVRRKDLHLLL